MKSKERIVLTNQEKIHHYTLPLALLLPTIYNGFFFVKFYLLEIPNQHSEYLENLWLMLGCFITALILFFLKKKRTYFQEYKGKLSDKDFRRAVKLTAEELNWTINKLTNSYAKAYRYPEVYGSGEERIIIKRTAEKIIINSICNPVGHSVNSLTRNKENIHSFAFNAAQILRGENVEKNIKKRILKKEADFWNENEWSFGNIMMRITGYGLFLLFLLIGFLTLQEGEWGKKEGILEGIFSILTSIAIGFIFVKTDIKILLEKRKRKKNK